MITNYYGKHGSQLVSWELDSESVLRPLLKTGDIEWKVNPSMTLNEYGIKEYVTVDIECLYDYKISNLWSIVAEIKVSVGIRVEYMDKISVCEYTSISDSFNFGKFMARAQCYCHKPEPIVLIIVYIDVKSCVGIQKSNFYLIPHDLLNQKTVNDFSLPQNINTEILLRSGDHTMHVNKHILMLSSSSFREILSAGINEIEIKGADFLHVLSFLRLMYRYKQEITPQNIACLLSLAKTYDVPFLMAYCEDFLISTTQLSTLKKVRYADFYKLTKLQVWNVFDEECTSVLCGHSGIITSCSFHKLYDWVVSSSNDTTMRIWDWRMKQCIAKLIGHRKAVTGAIFHPTSSVVFSTSKDGTIRVWDITEFGNKETSVGKKTGDDVIRQIEAKYESYGEQGEGLNSISFKESEFSLVAAGSDDNKLVLYNYDEENKFLYYMRLYEGHDNIVNSGAFHPYCELIIGCSDDLSIRIWDIINSECIDILRYQNEKFGVLAAHPSSCLFAAGHENGMILFKIRRERPLFCVDHGFAYYVRDTNWGPIVREFDIKRNKDVHFKQLENCSSYSKGRRALSFNTVESSFIFTRRTPDCKKYDYEFHKIHWERDGKRIYQCLEGSGTHAFWISLKQFVVLNEHQKIEIRDLSNAIICELDIIANDIFYAGTGMILMKIEDEYKLYDIEKKSAIASVQLTDDVRYVIWSKLKKYAAFLTKRKLILLNRNLEILCIWEESNNLKSGCWIDESVFVYNTRYQLKYAFISGDSGIIKTLDWSKQLYIFADRRREILCCFDRKANIVEVPIESSEYKLKLALFRGRIDEVVRLMESQRAKFVGKFMIAVLVKYGYSDIALNFEKDDRARFLLALECGNLEKAMEAAERLDEYDAWTTLAEAALLHGNHKIAEICYLKTKNYEKLSFLYFVTGNTEKVRDLMKVIDDPNVQFQITLLTGDIGERIRILKRCDQLSLAYLAAATHGYDNEVEELKKEFEFNKRPIPTIDPNSKSLVPPRPFHRLMKNWPVVKFVDNFVDDPGLGTNDTCEKVCEVGALVGERIGEKLEERIDKELKETFTGTDDYGEVLNERPDNVSLGGYPCRHSLKKIRGEHPGLSYNFDGL